MDIDCRPDLAVLVLGLGNDLLGDDGQGLRAVRHLAGRRSWPPEVLMVEVHGGLILQLGAVSRCRSVVCLDAVSVGDLPGTVHELQLDDRPLPARFARDPHGLAFEDLVGLSRWLTGFPTSAVILGVEPLSLEPGTGLSGPVIAGLDALVLRAEAIVKRALRRPVSADEGSPHHGAARR